MKMVLGLLLRFVLGIVGTLVVIMLLLMVANQAFAQSTPVHEAKLGEIDRSLNYESATHGLEYVAVVGSHRVTMHQDRLACNARNVRTYAYVKMIAREIAKNPKLGHIYVGALNTLHAGWCVQDDN